MEAVRKKSRRGHGRRKPRQQEAAAELQDEPLQVVSFVEDLGEDEPVPAELLDAFEALDDVPPLEDVEARDGDRIAALDDEIAENEEALLAILGAGGADGEVKGDEADAAASDNHEDDLLVAEASGSFPGNHGRDDDGSIEQPSGFASVDREKQRSPLSIDMPSAPAFEMEEDTAPAEAVGKSSMANVDVTSSISPSAPAFDFMDLHESDQHATEGMDSVVTASTGIALPSAPPLFHDAESEQPVATNGGDVKPTSVKAGVGSQNLEAPPRRPTAPLAFHSVVVETDEGSNTSSASAPSAPLEFEIDENYAAYRETPRVASAPSLSPTSSKQLRHSVSFEDPAKLEPVTRAHLRVDSGVSAKNATVAVRASLSKSKVSDAHRNSIYPSVPVTTMDDSTKAASTKLQERKTYESLLKKQHIRVNLEPFVNFEMNLMRAEASQKRQEMKMRHIEANKGELYARLERYLFSEYILRTASSSLEASKNEIDTLVKKVWTIEKKRLSLSKRCGDNVEIDQQLDFQTAKFEAQRLERLRSHLDKLRQLRTVESTMHTFDRATAFFHVEQYLNSVLQDPNLIAFLNKMGASCATGSSTQPGTYAGFADLDLVPDTINFFDALPAGTPLSSAVDHLKYCIDVLVFFEKKVTLEEKGLFSRIPQSFYRGELVMQSTGGKVLGHHGGGYKGSERKVKCYACGCLNPPMAANQWCRLCEGCEVVLYMPPSSVSTKSNEWYSSVIRFRQSLQKWISTCLQALLRTKALSNMPFLLMHIMYLPRISTDERSWVLRFLQFPRGMVAADGSLKLEWNEDLVDHYLAMMHLVFHPEKLRRMAILVSSGPTTALSSKIKPKTKKFDENGLVSPEWVLLENPEMLDRYYLSDDDFVAVLNQFPNSFAFEQVFRCGSDVKKSFSRALTLVLEFTNSLRAFQEFEKLPSRVAQLLGELLAYAAQVPEVIAARSRADEAMFYPTLFDQLFLTALNGLMLSDSNRVAWKYLNCFPFGSLTEPAKWDVLALLLFNIPNVPEEAKSASGWMRFVNGRTTGGNSESRQPVRQVLYDLISHDTENAVHLLSAVANLAASCPISDGDVFKHRSDLVAVAVHELFVAGFTVPACKAALGDSGDRAAVPISQICLSHPWVISLLITLLFKYHECAETWIRVFETFPVNRWVPGRQDLTTIQEWLQLDETNAPRSQLARFLLDHINWEYDVKHEELFTSAAIHRRVSLIVAESLVLYKTRRERATEPAAAVVVSGSGAPQKLEVAAITKSIRRALWLDESVDFEKWCWRLILKLKFYSPKTHEPYLKLIDVQRDRSREALTLRRWFSAISTNAALLHKGVQFYTSVEEEVLRWGEQNGEASIDGSGQSENVHAGGPIQEIGVESSADEADCAEVTDVSTAAQTTEPIVAYVICQMTSFLFTDRLDRWEPLLVLLKRAMFPAAVRVLDNVLPVLSRLNTKKRLLTTDSSPDAESGEVEQSESAGLQARRKSLQSEQLDHDIDVCMAAIQSLNITELLEFIRALHQFSYINAEEMHRMQDVLHKGYIGGWESTAKSQIQAKLRIIRICSRYLHPVVLPALINENFPESNPVALTTSALLHGAMSWISTALRGGEQDADPDSVIAMATSALSTRNSSLTANASMASGASGMLKGGFGRCSISARSLAMLIERAFEYATDDSGLIELASIWLNALLQVPYWYENYAFRFLVDTLLHCTMSYDNPRRLSEISDIQVSASSSRMTFDVALRFQQAFDRYCSALKRRKEQLDHPSEVFVEDDDTLATVSFLPSSSGSVAFSSMFGGAGDTAQYVEGCPHLALWLLLIETRQELPLFTAMGQLMINCEPKTAKKMQKLQTEGKLTSALADLGINTSPAVLSSGVVVQSRALQYGHSSFESLSQFRIYRWCAYCLELAESDKLQIVYWQVLFALYFACTGGSHVFGHYFLERSKRVSLRTELQAKLRKMTNYCSNQAQLTLTANSKGGNATAGTTSQSKEKLYAHFVALSQIYTAMDAWLEDADPNSWLKTSELVSLPRHYEAKRLEQVLTLSDVLVNTSSDVFEWQKLPLWLDLCGMEGVSCGLQHSDESNSVGSAQHLGASMDESNDDDEFAFVEEAAELARRHSSFGGFTCLGGGSGSGSTLNIRPLPLTREFAGVTTLTILPQVAVATTPTSCIVTPSIPLNQNGLKNVAVKFSENMSVLVALDAEMLDHVSQLYSSKPRTVTLSQACMEGTNCRSPAQFRFEFLEWGIDSHLSDAIESILAQAERCDLPSMVLSNMTSLMMEHHDATSLDVISDESGPSLNSNPNIQSVDTFLKLNAEDMMLALQILLIDQIVLSLDIERQRISREQQAAEAKGTNNVETPRDAESHPIEELGSDKDEDENETESERLQRKLDRLNEKGLEWFRLLTSLDTKLARMIPPLREVLWRSIKQLGLSFVCVDERETCTLLQLMLDDPSRINLLSECFFPASAPSRFVEMFSNLMSASSSSKLSIDEKLSLLRRFDFRAWLNAKPAPSKFDRETILCIILGDISNQFPADRSVATKGAAIARRDTSAPPAKNDRDYLRDVRSLYATTLRLICSKHLEDHVEKMLHALVGVHDDYHFHVNVGNESQAQSGSESGPVMPRPVDPAIWEALVAVPSEAWQALPFVVVESCISFLSQHVRTLRWQGAMASSSRDSAVNEPPGAFSESTARRYPISHWQRLGVLKHFLDVFTVLCRAAPDVHKWDLIVQFFEPLLCTLYQPATTTDMSSVNAPWGDQDAMSTGTTLCSCFVATCSDYLKSGNASKSPAVPQGVAISGRRPITSDSTDDPAVNVTTAARLSEIWSFYLSALVAHAPLHVCKHFHQFLTRLAWEHWCLTLENVQQMRELVDTEKQQLRIARATATTVNTSFISSSMVLSGRSTSESGSQLASSPYPFVSWLVRDILCRTKWKATEEWLNAQTQEMGSTFLLEFAKLCVDLVLDLPHFWSAAAGAPQRGRIMAASTSSSNNVLPPYFVNFIKQQATLWVRWHLTDVDLKLLLQYSLDAMLESLMVSHDGHGGDSSRTSGFPSSPSTAVMQDAFSRVQLTLRLLSQTTAIHHSKLTKKVTFTRASLFLDTLFNVFDVNDLGKLDGNVYASERSAWLLVLYGASCTVLYEKLDEIVQFCRRDDTVRIGNGADSNDADSAHTLTEEELTSAVMHVLRFCNLSLVERFFRMEQQTQGVTPRGGSNGGSLSLNWSKCGNVLFVEIDSLVRDFSGSQKTSVQQQNRLNGNGHHALGSDGEDESVPSTEGSSEDGKPNVIVATGGRSLAEAVGGPLGRLLWSFLGFRGGERACLSACGRAIASVHVMSQVAEKSIEKWVIEERRGSWVDLADRLKVPELSEDEFETACLELGKLLTLQVLFLQHLRRAPVMTEALAMGMLSRLMTWLRKLRVGSARNSLTEMKVLFIAAEAVNFVCKTLADVLPSPHKKQALRELSDVLLALGDERKNSGIMKAIGMGGSLKYNVEFHVCCLAVGIFLRLQTRASVPLRVDDRIPFKVTRTTDRHIRSLEHLLTTKDCIQLAKRMEWALDFIKSPSRSLADQDEFFVSLFSRMYPSHPWLLAKSLQ